MSERAFQPDWFSKPGDTIAALMAQRNFTHREMAAKLATDLLTLRKLLAGTVGIDSRLATQLSVCLGGAPSFWMKRDATYREALTRAARTISDAAVTEWLRLLPPKAFCDFGWIQKSSSPAETVKTYMSYFGVSTPAEWQRRYVESVADVAFRTSPSFESKMGALSAWLRQGELEASIVSTKQWSTPRLRDCVNELRRLSKRKTPSTFIPHLRTICASAGVAVVFVRAPSGCRASGATRFLSPDKAMVVLSFRHLSDDHFWFTFFHEIGHLVLHGKDATFIDGEPILQNKKEEEANAFAANVLIPMERHEEMISLKPRMEAVVRFAVSIGVAPGIVVGQMQHERAIGPQQLNFLKRRYRWEELAAAFD